MAILYCLFNANVKINIENVIINTSFLQKYVIKFKLWKRNNIFLRKKMEVKTWKQA